MLVALMAGVLRPGTRIWWGGALHGLLGLAGFVLLLWGLQGPARGMAQGAGSFGFVAAFFTGGARLLGVLMLAGQLKRRQPGVLLIGVHATVAIIGVVMLLAYLSV